MAILNLKNKKAGTEIKVARKIKVKSEPKDSAVAFIDNSKVFSAGVLIRPRVTEKATFLSEKGRMVYVFEVSRSANKRNISEAIKGLYKVVPDKVAVLKVPSKKSFVQGRMSRGKTGRKAYVYLKKGEKIEVI